MRILVVGANGTIGSAVAAALAARHEVVPAGRSAAVKVDISQPASIREMYKSVGRVDAVVSCAGQAKFAPLVQLTDEDFRFSLDNKLMGQINLVRYGGDNISDGGSFTLTTGVLSRKPMPGSGAISLVNGGVEAFARAAALEAARGIRVNVVSPPWVAETLAAMKMDPAHGMPAATLAQFYVQSVEGSQTGTVIETGS